MRELFSVLMITGSKIKSLTKCLLREKIIFQPSLTKRDFRKKIAVYRVGYFPDDKEGVPLAEYDIPGSSPENSFFMKLDVTGNCINNTAPGFLRDYPELNASVPQLSGVDNCPVRAVKKIAAVKIFFPAENVYIYDLGQEIVGVCSIKFNGRRGETAIIRYAEMLYPDLPEYGGMTGRLLTANLREAASTDKYILSGEKDEIYSPKFTFHGFRYIEISGKYAESAETSCGKGLRKRI